MSESQLLLHGAEGGTWVLCTAGRIEAVGSAATEPPPSGEGVRLDCRGGRIEPGQVNAHTHMYSGLVALGMPPPSPPPESFVEILQRVWWRLDRALDESSLRAAARLYVAESLLFGTTALLDHHESPNIIEGSLDILAGACDELGARALLCYGASERNDGLSEGRRGLAEGRRLLRERSGSAIVGAIALHASFTVSDILLGEAAELCRDLDAVMHVHVAEDRADVEDANRRGHAGPLERLLAFNTLPPGSILAHGVHLDAAQVRRAADLGLWLVQNPRSNLNNRVGYPQALDQSPQVALGSDGFPADMAAERAALAAEIEGHGETRSEIHRRAGGSAALAGQLFGVSLGHVEPGCAADLVVRNGDRTEQVLVAGKLVVRDGSLCHADLQQIRNDAAVQAERLWSRMASL